jgi:hypothetical protein
MSLIISAHIVNLEISTALDIEILSFWDMMLCNLVNKGCQLPPFYHCDPSALKMEAAGLSKMMVSIKLHGVILEGKS